MPKNTNEILKVLKSLFTSKLIISEAATCAASAFSVLSFTRHCSELSWLTARVLCRGQVHLWHLRLGWQGRDRPLLPRRRHVRSGPQHHQEGNHSHSQETDYCNIGGQQRVKCHSVQIRTTIIFSFGKFAVNLARAKIIGLLPRYVSIDKFLWFVIVKITWIWRRQLTIDGVNILLHGRRHW